MNKPKLIEAFKLDKKVVGNIYLDNEGYFYRPKGYGVKAHDPKYDGEHFKSLGLVLRSLEGAE